MSSGRNNANGEQAGGGDPAPEDVFTPRVPAGELMFVSRTGNQLGDNVADALNELGSQVVVYGDTGVGKTTLVLRAGGPGSVALIECLSAKSFADMVRDAFGSLGAVRELELFERDQTSDQRELGGGLGYVVSMTADFHRASETEDARTLSVYERPLVEALLDALGEGNKRILFFDNFENVASDSVRAGLAELMTAFSDRARGTGNVKIVVAGIAAAASDLITTSPASGRRIVSIGVLPMPDDEIAEIFTRGMEHLSLEARPAEVARVAQLSAGYPYVPHLIGLHAARAAQRAKAGIVSEEILDSAVRAAIEDFEFDFAQRYQRARERSGEVRPRQRLLHAMAEATQREFRFNEIVETYRSKFGLETNYTFLNQALGRLCTADFGALVSRRPEGGVAVYSFTNPLVRPYLRMIEERGDLPWAGQQPTA